VGDNTDTAAFIAAAKVIPSLINEKPEPVGLWFAFSSGEWTLHLAVFELAEKQKTLIGECLFGDVRMGFENYFLTR